MSYVYFLKPIGEDGPIKIGFSAVSSKRLKFMMRWSPFPLEIIGSVPGTFGDEKFLHDYFSIARSHHEWFHATPELLQTIKTILAAGSVAPFRVAPKPTEALKTVPAIIDCLGGASEFSRIIERPTSTGSEMKRRCSIPHHYWSKVITAAQARGFIGLDVDLLVHVHTAEVAA